MSKTFTVNITDEEMAAFERVVPDADEWVENAVRNKVRKAILRVVEATMNDIDNQLSPADKQTLNNALVAQDLVMVPWKRWPKGILKQIAFKSLLPTRKARDAAELEALVP